MTMYGMQINSQWDQTLQMTYSTLRASRNESGENEDSDPIGGVSLGRRGGVSARCMADDDFEPADQRARQFTQPRNLALNRFIILSFRRSPAV